ncbi:MAG: hypothetical protein ACP5N0_10605 [Methanosarcina sp.]|jgi:hypothetical protein|uniref:hypothetical protein n=1 Tax=Methanosarcina sp. TaxID=2213 RepID=UPI003BB4976D
MKIKYLIFLSILLVLTTVSTTSASTTTVHPHEGNTYWVGADGHKISLINNNSAVNPTYEQLLTFLKADKTDEKNYIPGKYTCGDFAEAVHNNAEKKGYKAAWVTIEFKDVNGGHACNAFNTKDKGIVYIDCTGSYPHKSGNWDTIVKMQVGKQYKPTPLFRSGYTYYSMGTVKSFGRYW